MTEPPNELDGAKVIMWAWSGQKPFGLIPMVNSNSGPDSIEIFGLAICQYTDSDCIYRFSCDKNWEVQQDEVYDSIDEALSQLPDQYKLITAGWKTK